MLVHEINTDESSTSLIKAIYDEKEREKSEDRDNLLKLTSKRLYGEKIHYVLELIQNAEDEESSKIIFIFRKNAVIVVNDGISFSNDNVRWICSVKTGSKKKKIGFFGIGFKSVFSITNKPQIISGIFNFRIERYIYPTVANTIPAGINKYRNPDRGAIFILPSSEGMPSTDDLIENFSKAFDSKILLFLNYLTKVEFHDEINNVYWDIEKKPSENSEVILVDGRREDEEKQTRWRVFHKDLVVKDDAIVPEGKKGVTDTRLTLAFPTDEASREEITKRGVLYCYLPTKKRTDLRYLVQADFLPTIGRENIAEDSIWNDWLLKNLGIMSAETINFLKDDPMLGNYIYELIPLEEEIQDPLIQVLSNALTKKLRQLAIAKTIRGWLRATKCVIPHNDNLRSLFQQIDLKTIFQESVYYIRLDISGQKDYTRAERVLFELGAKNIRTREVIDFIKLVSESKPRSPEWYLRLYSYLSVTFQNPDSLDPEYRKLFEELKTTKFILSNNHKLVALEEVGQESRLICYPQNLDFLELQQVFTEGDIILLHPYFQESGIIRRKVIDPEIEQIRKVVKDWFDEVGVRKYVKQWHVIRDVILPKYSSGKYLEYDDRKNYELINYIRNNWSYIETDINSKKLTSDFVNRVADTVRVRAYKYVKKVKEPQYSKPSEIYFSKRYGKTELMEDLFMGIDGPVFLSPYYINREQTQKKNKSKRGRQRAEYSWRKFFEILRVWASPQVSKDQDKRYISYPYTNYSWVKRQWSSAGHWVIGDSQSDHIVKLIELCSTNSNSKDVQNRLRILWESLSKYWKNYIDREFCTSTYGRFYYKPIYEIYNTSSFLEHLRNSAWVLSDKNNFYKPSELYVDSTQNRFILHDDTNYLVWRGNEQFLKDLQVKMEPTYEEVLGNLVKYREANNNPQGNQIKRKFETVYMFLFRYLNTLRGTIEIDGKIKEIAQLFEDRELLFIPRSDKKWWKPSEVFLEDISDRFGMMCGYLEDKSVPIYSRELTDFFGFIGVKRVPNLDSCIGVLKELVENNDEKSYKIFATRIFSYIETLMSQNPSQSDKLDESVFLSENRGYFSPSQLVYEDIDEFQDYFKKQIKIMWLPCSWVNLKTILKTGGFTRISECVTVSKHFKSITEVEGDRIKDLKQRLIYALYYLRSKQFQQYEYLINIGVLKLIKELEVYHTSQILLDFELTINGQVSKVEDILKTAYYSREENRLYTLSSANLMSGNTAKELSKLFINSADDIILFLNVVFSAIDEDDLINRLHQLGIRPSEIPDDDEIASVNIVGAEENSEDNAENKDNEPEPENEPKGDKGDQIRSRPLPPQSGKDKKSDLVNLEDYKFVGLEKYVPYTGHDGKNKKPVRTIKLRKGRRGYKDKPPTGQGGATRGDAEAIAISIAMGFEEIENRYPDDRHDQPRIGYDIYSSNERGQELFIEVKHFRGDAGTWQLTPHEWLKAITEKKKYYVYIVSRLKQGNIPQIDIIQDPAKFLTPDPPEHKQYSSWRNGICRVVKLDKV